MVETGLQPLGAPGSVMAARKYSDGAGRNEKKAAGNVITHKKRIGKLHL